MSIWNSLAYRAGSDAIDAASSIRYRYNKKPDGNLEFVSNSAYRFALAHWVQREAIALAMNEINQLFPKYQRYLEGKLRKHVQAQQEENRQWIIKNYEETLDKTLGIMQVDGGSVRAVDRWGRLVPEAIILSFDGEESHHVSINTRIGASEEAEDQTNQEFDTKSVWYYDVAPEVSCNSSKNIVMTQVQGRDFTRKEMVSGGDLNFTVSGNIVSHLATLQTDRWGTEPIVQYPENEVKKFIAIMQHPGIINVNHFLFRQFNVTKIIIKDFDLPKPEFKNIQPYRFTCVAVEPDEDVIIKADTITMLNNDISLSPMSKWYKFILNNKLAEITAGVASDVVSNATAIGLDMETYGVQI